MILNILLVASINKIKIQIEKTIFMKRLFHDYFHDISFAFSIIMYSLSIIALFSTYFSEHKTFDDDDFFDCKYRLLASIILSSIENKIALYILAVFKTISSTSNFPSTSFINFKFNNFEKKMKNEIP